MSENLIYQEIKNQKKQSIYLINAVHHELYLDSFLISPQMGFTTSLAPQLEKENDNITFINSSKIVFMLDMHQSEIEQLIVEARKKLISEIEHGKDSILDTIQLATSLLVWKAPQSDKYLAILDCKDSDNLLYWIDKKIKDNIFFKCMNMSIPLDISDKSKNLFFKKNINNITQGAENKAEFWDLMTRLDKATYEIIMQKKDLEAIITSTLIKPGNANNNNKI